MAVKVKLRQKSIGGNMISLYLDYYPPILNSKTGKLTRREFLNKYIHAPIKEIKRQGKDDRVKITFIYDNNPSINATYEQHNINTLAIAEQARMQRQNMLDKPEIYTDYELEQLKKKEKGNQNFVEYFKKLADKRKASNHDNWVSAYHYLENFTNGFLRFSDIDESIINEFKEYLLSTNSRKSKLVTLSQNSAVSYFNKIKAALKQAYKEDYLPKDINSKIETIKPEETQREFLSLEELNILVKTDCKDPILKKAALFSALTGLRFSDIEKLRWNEIVFIDGDGYFIRFTQQKTKGVEMLPISEQAFKLLGEKDENSDKVFEGLYYSAYGNKHLAKWIESAGIKRKITFHSFRHAFATIQLSKGTDIYTVSKMLGHRELKTTQIYAKIIDKTKREAANRIELDM